MSIWFEQDSVAKYEQIVRQTTEQDSNHVKSRFQRNASAPVADRKLSIATSAVKHM